MKKRIAVLIGALLILCISFTSTVAVFEIENFWGLIDNNTLTTLNETWNVSIGKNDTTTYKLFVNGSFYANSLFGDGGNLTNISGVNGIGYWNRSNTILYTAIDNDSVQINGSLNVSTVVNLTVETGWWNINWSYYKTITIDSDYIDSTLTNFPILISINDTIGDKCKANGEDIRFLLPDNSTELYYEIEKWVDNDERLVWVNALTITSDVDTVILMYYGNSEASDNQNPSDVWDSSFMAVWHMNSLLDSTNNDIDLINEGCDAGATGKIGDCYAWIGANTDWLYHSTFLDVMPVSDEITFESWCIRPVDANYNIFSKSNIVDQDRLFFRLTGGKLELFGEGTAGGNNFCTDTVDLGDADEWNYTVGMYKIDTALKIIRQGIYITTGDVCEHIRDGTDSDFYIGTHLGASGYYNGRIDEIRVSNVVRSDSWIKATFHSSNQSNGFLIFGSEQEYILEYYDKKIDLLKVDVDLLQVNFSVNISLQDDARVKRHVRVTAPSWKKGVTAPTETQIGIFPVLSFDKDSDDVVYYSLIIPYRIETGSEIAVNIDWCYTGANDVGTVHWNLSYINVGVGESVDGVLSHIEKTSTGNHVSGKLVNTYLTGNIIGAVAHDILGLKLVRDTSEDTLNTDAHMIQVHFEFLEDKLGEPI